MRLVRAIFGAVAVAGLAAGSAVASNQGGSTAPAAAETSDKKTEALVCRKLTISGSRMPRRVCATKIEWEEQTKRAAQGLEDSQEESHRRPVQEPSRF